MGYDRRPADRRYRAKRRERLRQRNRQWIKDHPEVNRANVKRWEAMHPEQARAKYAARRARKRAAFVESVDPGVLFERDHGICGICKEPANREDFHIDHIVPLVKGGKHCYANVQVAHPQCNMSKGSKTMK